METSAVFFFIRSQEAGHYTTYLFRSGINSARSLSEEWLTYLILYYDTQPTRADLIVG